MKISYKAILSNIGFYREYTFPEEKGTVRLGTTGDSDLSIPKSSCDTEFSLELSIQRTSCTAVCVEGVRFSDGSQELAFQVTDKLALLNAGTGTSMFVLQIVIAVDRKQPYFELGVELPQGVPVIIGGADTCVIRIKDRAIGDDSITLRRDGSSYNLQTTQTQYGVYVNGKLSCGSHEVRNNSFISLDGLQFYIRNGYLYIEAGVDIRYPDGWSTVDSAFSKSHLDYPKFNKSTRLMTVPSSEAIEILDPPAKAEQKKSNIILQLLPAIVMLVLVVMLRGVMGGGGTYVIFSACSIGLGVCTSIASIVIGKRDTRIANEERVASYQGYISRKREEIAAARDKEKRQLEDIYRSLERDIQAVKDFSTELFDRSVADSDFLQVYIGTGDQPT
ncbi:MAG: hypothetical protein QMB62_13235, partial [Oscillospiraceae bacterium]